ncbi:MAG TPA: hypothetical protein VM470_07930 [Acidimicrobiia bacterium]|nr:hypothetical protein [Acidimicrobiia bacterium]
MAESNELLATYQTGGRPEPQLPEAQLPAVVPGQVVGLEGQAGLGITRLGLSLLAAPSRIGLVVALDVRGWLSPSAAWEVGVLPHRLVVIRCPDHRLWPQVAAACLEGVAAVYAEVPSGVGEQQLRRLLALNRARKSALILRPIRGQLPAGVTHWRVRGTGVIWEGADRGHGRLTSRTLTAQISGKSIPLRELQLGESHDVA